MGILEMSIDELSSGSLRAAFASGAHAVVIYCGAEVKRLWAGLLEDEREQLPWEAPLLDIARNHHGSRHVTSTLGDLYYFQPGEHGYIARKLQLTKSEDGALQVKPDQFWQGPDSFVTPRDTLDHCCDLAARIMDALGPSASQTPAYKVVVQRLKYQASHADFDKLADLARDGLGRWGRVGFNVDRNRQDAAGPFRRKGWSDLFGLFMLSPWLSRLARQGNSWFVRSDPYHRSRLGDRVVEHPHHDARFFTGLCGARDNVRTEAFIDGAWQELPVNLDALTILPGRKAEGLFGLKPTLHRVVQTSAPVTQANESARTTNVTLLIGAA
jgi:hypothetical protein